MQTLFTGLMPKYGNTFVQGFYLEFKNKSCYISLQEDIFRKAFKISARARNYCKSPVEQTSGRNSIGLTVFGGIPRTHLVFSADPVVGVQIFP